MMIQIGMRSEMRISRMNSCSVSRIAFIAPSPAVPVPPPDAGRGPRPVASAVPKLCPVARR